MICKISICDTDNRQWVNSRDGHRPLTKRQKKKQAVVWNEQEDLARQRSGWAQRAHQESKPKSRRHSHQNSNDVTESPHLNRRETQEREPLRAEGRAGPPGPARGLPLCARSARGTRGKRHEKQTSPPSCRAFRSRALHFFPPGSFGSQGFRGMFQVPIRICQVTCALDLGECKWTSCLLWWHVNDYTLPCDPKGECLRKTISTRPRPPSSSYKGPLSSPGPARPLV